MPFGHLYMWHAVELAFYWKVLTPSEGPVNRRWSTRPLPPPVLSLTLRLAKLTRSPAGDSHEVTLVTQANPPCRERIAQTSRQKLQLQPPTAHRPFSFLSLSPVQGAPGGRVHTTPPASEVPQDPQKVFSLADSFGLDPEGYSDVRRAFKQVNRR